MRTPVSKFTLSAFYICASLVLLAGVVEVTSYAFATEEEGQEVPLKPVPIEGATAKINATNSRVEFVGIHTGGDPKPRLGGFKQFEGVLAFDGQQLKTVSVQFRIASIWTEFDKLTQHLQAADFFGAQEFPTAAFLSTEVTPTDNAGEYQVTGTMNMHGTDSQLTFPVKVTVSDQGVMLDSEFKLDRSAFGMTEHLDGVEKLVSITVKVGQGTKNLDPPTTKPAEPVAPAGEAPLSGLAVGQSVEPWTPVHVSGPDKGTKTCPVCNYLSQPAIVIFAKENGNTEQLLGEVEKLLAKYSDKKLKGFVAVLDSTPEVLELMATDQGLKLTSLCYPDAKTGQKDLAAYKVNGEVENTVMIYKDYKVMGNWVDLKADQVGPLEAAVAKMVE